MSIFMQRCLDYMNLMNFKIQGFLTTLIIGTVSALTISDAISQKVNAQATPSCNNATIKGSYGFKTTGKSGTREVAGVGLVQLNGSGNVQGTQAASIGGTVSVNETVSGIYSVKQDCTVLIIYTNGASTTGTIVDGGKEIFFLQTNPGTIIVENWKKVN